VMGPTVFVVIFNLRLFCREEPFKQYIYKEHAVGLLYWLFMIIIGFIVEGL